MTSRFNKLYRGLLWVVLGAGLLFSATSASAQINITESTVASGDFQIAQQRVTYKFTIQGARTGTDQDSARVAPYYYVIYATGIDIYGNRFYIPLSQGNTNELFGAIVTSQSRTEATTQTFEGSWTASDVTLANYFPLRPDPQRFPFDQIVLVLYGDGVTPATAPADDAAFLLPTYQRAAGEIYWYVRPVDGPDLQMEGMTYNAGSYEGGDVIRMTTTWRNLVFPLGASRGEIYKFHNMLTENSSVDWKPPVDPNNPPDAVVPDNDDFLLAEVTMGGDQPIVSPVDFTPIVPDGSSIVRTVEVADTPGALPAYGIVNPNIPPDPVTGPTYYAPSLRIYQPQPDDGWLDVGEAVSVTVEVKVPQNYAGTYFVAGRIDPENTIPEPVNRRYVNTGLYFEFTDGQPDNNTFVSNASAKITIDGPTVAPTVEAVSAIAFEDGQYVQGGGETSNESSVSADGNVIAFSSAARNLLVPPQLGERFIEVYGRGADMANESVYDGNPEFDGVIQPYLTAGQQIFYRLRQTRENYLASGLAGIEANANCFNPSINSGSTTGAAPGITPVPGGRYIAFDSRANNLGVSNTGNRSLIYVTDTANQTIVAVSRAAGQTVSGQAQSGALANGDCFNPSISSNGRFVAFESVADNLDPSRPVPLSTKMQVYLRDRDADGNNVFDEPGAGKTATYLVSVDSAGNPANGLCSSPSLNTRESLTNMYVAYVSTATALPGGTGSEQVFRVTVNVGGASPGPDASSVLLISENTNGEPSNQPAGAPNGSIEPSISGDGSQVAFSSSANNLVYNPDSGAWDADTNEVPDVFVRNLNLVPTDPLYTLKGLVRISESIPRVATGTISFTGPTVSFIDPLGSPYIPGSIVNIPQNNPQDGDTLQITTDGTTATFVFRTAPAASGDIGIGEDVDLPFPNPVTVITGKDVFATRDNLINAINSEPGLNLQAYATSPPNPADPTAAPPGPDTTAYVASIYVRSLVLGTGGNGTMVFTPAVPPLPPATPVVVATDLAGGGTQVDDAALAVQGVPAGSNQPSISEDGRVVAYRSIAGNLDVTTLTAENDFGGGPPYDNTYQPSPRQGELIRPILFPASNVYVRNRQVDTGLSGLDQEGNVATERLSLNNFGYPTTVSAQQGAGLGAFTTAANQAPAIGGNGRVISFSSGSEIYGGLVFGRNNLEPLDFQNARDVYVYDSQSIGEAPPPTESRPDVDLVSPENGLRVPTGSTISLSATVLPKLGKSIASVQFYVNGAAVGAPLTGEPYSVTYKLANPGQYVILAVATDSRGITGVASSIISAGAPLSGASPTVAITQPTSQVVNVVASSDLVFNAFAEDSDGIKSVTFYFGGEKFDGIPSNDGNWYFPKRLNYPPGAYSLFAMAVDNNNNASVTDVSTVNIFGIGASFPSLEIVTNNDGLPCVAGGTYPLRARLTATVPGLDFDENNSGVLFYADGVYLGLGVLQPDGTYLLNWNVPTTPRTYAKIEAYLSAPNRLLSTDPLEYANCIVKSKNSITNLKADAATLPTVALIKPAAGAQIGAGVATLLEATASAPDGQGTIQRVEFYQNGQLITGTDATGAAITSDAAFPYQINFTPPSPGQYTLTALAYTTAGVIKQSTPVVVNAVIGAAPTVSLTSPASPSSSVNVGENVIIAADAKDADGSVVSVTFLVNGVPLPSGAQGAVDAVNPDLAAPFRFIFTPTSAGRYEIIARAVDNLGNVKDSDPVTVNAGLPVGTVTVNFSSPAASTKFVPGTSFSALVDVTSSINAPIQSVTYYLNGVPVTSTTSTGAVVGPQIETQPFSQQVTLPNAGTYKLRAVASDIYGNAGVAERTIQCASPSSGTPPLISTVHPVPGGAGDTQNDFSTPSQFYFNAVVTAADLASIPTSNVKFFANGRAVDGTVTKVGNTFAVKWQPDSAGDYDITAQVTDTSGFTAVSQPLNFIIAPPVRPMPTLAVLPLPSSQATVGSKVYVQVTSNEGLTPISRIDFYANQVLIGSAVPQSSANTDVTTVFNWTPTTAGTYEISARAIQVLGEVGDNSLISNSRTLTVSAAVGQAPLVNLLQQPISETIYVIGSELFFNATVDPRSGAAIPTTGDPVNFFFGNELIPAEASGVKTGSLEIYSAYAEVRDGRPNALVFATARDSNNNIGSSDSSNLFFERPLYPLPTVDMLPLTPGTKPVASGNVTLRARAFFPPTANRDARVEFYANGAYVGAGTQDATDSTLYTFVWKLPSTPDSYLIEARALALNYETNVENQNVIRHFGSVISDVPEEVNTLAGTEPVVSITAPTNRSDTPVNVPLTIRADATVVGSTIAEVQFYVDGNLIFVGSVDPDTGEVTPDPANPNPDTTFPYQITFTPSQTGPQEIYAIAVGANGLRKVSDVATVNVVSGAKPTSFLTTSTSAKATALVNTNTKVVTGFTNLVGGNGYTTNAVPDVRLVGGTTNTVATVKAVVGTNGSVTGFTNLVGGSGYTNVPTVVIDPPLFQIGSAGGGTNTNGAGGTSVLLQAAAADTDGTIRQVDFLQNGVVVGTVTNAPYSFNLPLTAVGRYELIARATDNLGNVTDSPYIVLNGVKGTPPTVSITTPRTNNLTTPQTILNIGWSANDADGSVVNVQLLVNGAPEGAPVPGGSGITPYQFTSQGKYVFVARATDNLGNVTDSSPVTVTVDNTAPPVVPVVNLLQETFSDVNYVAGSQMYFNATATARGSATIPTNGVSFYLSGPDTTLTADLTKITVGTNPVYAFSALQPYTLNTPVSGIVADATDSAGVSGSSSFYPLRGDQPSRAPLPSVQVPTNLPPSSVAVAGGVVQLQAKASFPAPIGAANNSVPPRVEFYADGAFIGIAQTNTAANSTTNEFTHFLNWRTPTNAGSFKITARAVSLNFATNIAQGGATNVVNYFGAKVSPGILPVNTLTNRPPSVFITKPATNNSQVGLGVTNQIVATVSNLAANASVKEVQWYVDGLLVTNSTKFPYIYDFAPTNIGLYNLAAVVVDNFGLQGSSDVRTINAVAGSAPIVTLSAPTNGVVGGTARLVATATDVDGTIAEVDFLVNGVPAPVPALTNAPYVYNLPLNSAGRYVLEARAKDNLGNLGFSSPQTLTVSGGTTPVVSIISPTNGSTLSVGVPVTLVANASDPDGSVTSVTFRVNGTAYPATQNLGVWNAQFTPTSPGEYRVVATAVDNSGNEGISPEFIYRIPTATGLTVSMVSPADGSVYTLGTPVILNALPSVIVGTVTSVQFYVLGTPVGTPITTAPYTLAYDPPTTGNYTVYALATDSSGNVAISSSRNFSVDVAPPSGVPSIFLSAPQGTYLTRGSRAYINYTVVLPSGGDPVPAQNVQIYIDGVPVPQSEIKKIGPKGDTYSYLWTVGNSPNISVYATVVDAFGTSGFSGITTFTTAQPQRQRPVVEMLTFEAPNPFFAVGVPVTLRARANFLNNANPALEFYANGVLLGPGIPGTTSAGYTTYSYQWVPTISSPAVTITARGSGENTAIILPPPPGGGTSATIPVLASVVSGNTVTPPVTDIPIQGVPDLTSSKQLNGQFVLWMFNQLLYRNPTYPEYAQFLGLLGPESGNATASVKADMVMNLMGYNTSTTLFNAATEYAQTSAIAFAPFGRLGLTPTSSTIINFISLTEADPSPLPLAGTYGGLTGAPWRATYGYARAMQTSIFDTAAFDKLYQGASGLTGNAFVIWMTGSTTAPVSPAYMFPDRLSGGNARVDLANMIDGTPTLTSPDAADILQGAGAAFQSEYIAAALNSGLASNDPGNTEKTFQRRLQSASLAFQLGRNLQPNGTWTTDGIWNFNGAQLYSKEVVSSILVQNGYAVASSASAAPLGRTQTISFRLPTSLLVGRTYRLSATASSRLTPITFSLEGDSNSRATLNGNLLTVTQPGTVTITASQGGGTAAARRSAAPVLFEPVSATRSATAIQRTR